MTAVVYPQLLPCPQTSTVTGAERRALSDPARPREARQAQVDRLEFERITFPPMTRANGQIILDWWRSTLVYGGAWFAADWPLPRGWSVTAVRKFLEQPRWEFVPGGYWRLSAVCEVRGAGMLPTSIMVIVTNLVWTTLDDGDTGYPVPTSFHPEVFTIGPYVFDSQLTVGQGAPSGGDDYLTVDGVRIREDLGTAATLPVGTVLKALLPAGETATFRIENTLDPACAGSVVVVATEII